MYTICWHETDGNKRWDRLSNDNDVTALVVALNARDIISEDILIIDPADGYEEYNGYDWLEDN